MFISNIWYCSFLCQFSEDIELNPEPNLNSCQRFSVCHGNLYGKSSHNFIKVSLLTTYSAIQKFDVICSCETYRVTSLLLSSVSQTDMAA